MQSPPLVTVSAAEPTFLTVEITCIALNVTAVPVVHEITYDLTAPPSRTSGGSLALALRVTSHSWLASGSNESAAAGVTSLDSSLLVKGASPSTHLQYVPYGCSDQGAPLSPGGGFYAGFPPGTGTFHYGINSYTGEDGPFTMVAPLSTLYPPLGGAAEGRLGITFLLDPLGGPLPPVLTGTTTTSDSQGVRFTFARSGLGLRGSARAAAHSAVAYVVAGAPDWRPALDFLVTLVPSLFEPAADVSGLWGAMQYGDYRGQALNASLLRDELGLRVNWDATFAFPFWGAWGGPLAAAPGGAGEDGSWEDCVAVGHVDPFSGVPHPEQDGNPPPVGVPPYPGTGGCTRHSLGLVASWYEALRAATGVASLTYANLFEWGFALDAPVPPTPLDCPTGNTSAYCAAHALYRGGAGAGGGGTGFSSALVASGDYTSPGDWDGSRLLRGWPIAPGVKILDAAVEPYRSYVLDTLAAQLGAGGAAGFCVDRMDHTVAFNLGRDDGVAWHGGGPAAWLGASFVSVAGDMLAGAHAGGFAGLVSLLNPRLDLVGQFDGHLNEFGDMHTAEYGILGLAKPSSGWYWWNHSHGAVAPEVYLQRCVLAGQSPMVPWEAADHGAMPRDGFNPDPTPTFLAYAPLYTLLVRKRWLLTPGAVALAPGASAQLWANAYDVAAGLLLPVIDGASTSIASVSLSTYVGEGRGGLCGAFALHPGGGNTSVPARVLGIDSFAFDSVPLIRGVVVLQLVFGCA